MNFATLILYYVFNSCLIRSTVFNSRHGCDEESSCVWFKPKKIIISSMMEFTVLPSKTHSLEISYHIIKPRIPKIWKNNPAMLEYISNWKEQPKYIEIILFHKLLPEKHLSRLRKNKQMVLYTGLYKTKTGWCSAKALVLGIKGPDFLPWCFVSVCAPLKNTYIF